MRYEKGSPEAKAYMAEIRARASGAARKAKVIVADTPSEGLSMTRVRDSKGNEADSLHITPEYLEKMRLEIEERRLLREERTLGREMRAEQKAQKEQGELVKKALIGGGILFAAWFLFIRPKAQQPVAPSTPTA